MNTLLKGKDSTLPGFPSLPVDIGKLHDALAICQHDGVTYKLGAKAVQHSAFPVFDYPPTFSQIDCSGFSRFSLYHATAGQVLLPDGSVNQNDWCAAQGFKHRSIAAGQDYTAGMGQNVLYLCFCRTGSRSEAIGHVWMVAGSGGQLWTIESNGGVGPNSRPASTPVLMQICTDIYAVAKF